MERCDFASVTAVLRENLMDGSFDNQIGFVSALFESYIRENEVFFDNGLLNKWLNGLAKVSPAIGQYYYNSPDRRNELAETLKNRILPGMADSAMAVKEVQALLLQDESVSSEKKTELCGRMGETCAEYAEFLADTLIFGMVRRPFIARDIRKSSSPPFEIRYLPLSLPETREPRSRRYDEGGLYNTPASGFGDLLRGAQDIDFGESAIRMVWNVAHLNTMEDFERGVHLLFRMQETLVQNESNVLITMLFSTLRAANALRSASENCERTELLREKFEYARSIMASLLLTGQASLSRQGNGKSAESYAESQPSRGPPLNLKYTFEYVSVSEERGTIRAPQFSFNLRSISAQ